MWRKLGFLIGIAVLCASTVTAVAQAEEKTPDILVSPAIMEWIIGPGEKQSKKVIVRNTTDHPLPVRTIAQSFVPRERIAQQDQYIFNASSWFHIKDPDFILKVGEYREVTVEVAVPKDAEPGGHYATVYFQQLQPANPQKKQQTSIVGRVGSLGFVTVKGHIKRQVTRTVPLRVSREGGGYTFSTTLKNVGNAHVLPKVTYTVKDSRGRRISTAAPPPGVLLPRTERTYQARWQDPPFIGRFTVTANLSYDGEGKGSTGITHTIWQIPMRIILPIVLVPFLGWLGGYRIRHRWQRAWRVLWKQ